MNGLERRPIFVVGVARSGTTLLRYMLCSHPHIYIPPESNFIPGFSRRHPTEPMGREQARRVLERISRYGTFWRDWREEPLDADELLRSLPNLTPASLVDGVYSRYARQYGAVRWGDKSTIYAGYIDLFVKMFPTCQIVHTIRDPRDVTASSLDAYRGWRFFYMDPYYAARMWRERLGRGLEVGRRLGSERYYEIRYEDLTADPEGQLRELCAFLGEEFDPSMLSPQMEALKHYHKFGIHQRVRENVTTGRAGRWRRDLSPADQRLIQRVTRELLVELGYPLEDLGREGLLELLRGAALKGKFEVENLGRSSLRAIGVANPSRMLLSLPRRRPSPTAQTPATVSGSRDPNTPTPSAPKSDRAAYGPTGDIEPR